MTITIEGNFINENYFDDSDIQELRDFFYQYGEEYNWDVGALSQKAADDFCYRDNFWLEIDDEKNYLTGSVRDQINDRYYEDLYDSECDAIYNVMSNFKIPHPKVSDMDVE